ncbi:hypothetical protein JIN84_21405 [Luteolibacter yonseiensis]|uniref:Uncharacterized protein n=1 Tax=Luteolibacter yonseiensis TaxID=1144680 RepID=A0A934VDI8_9BACT|nr:hypothetical protein [Luteolibacter yonseiensis]MBK1818195.1 hypothetical protein [Luteolibacter yonseiensis]
MRPGKDFTKIALDKAKSDNIARNGGVMRDDITGEIMTPHPRTTKGSTVPPSAVQGDHVIPKKPKDPTVKPGSNSFKNLKLRRAEHNKKKSNKSP